MFFFNGIDDIMGIVEANEESEEEVNLVSGRDLNTIFVSSREQSMSLKS